MCITLWSVRIFARLSILQAGTRSHHSNKPYEARLLQFYCGWRARRDGQFMQCDPDISGSAVQGLLHMQKACHTPASVMCANRLLNSRTEVRLLVHAHWPFAQNWQPGQSYCYCSKWMGRNAEILDKWPCFLFFSWKYKIFRMEKKKSFFFSFFKVRYT